MGLLTYREITPVDAGELAPLFVETFNAPPHNGKWTVERASQRLYDVICRECVSGLMASLDGEICAMILGSAEITFDGRSFEVRELCVDVRHRGLGIDVALIQEMEKRLRKEGFSRIKMYLPTASDETFAEKAGFEPCGSMQLLRKALK
jgi:ribosomal protein S18 acetylase RimI-like enzyme